jgi:hypothetical protein
MGGVAFWLWSFSLTRRQALTPFRLDKQRGYTCNLEHKSLGKPKDYEGIFTGLPQLLGVAHMSTAHRQAAGFECRKRAQASSDAAFGAQQKCTF